MKLSVIIPCFNAANTIVLHLGTCSPALVRTMGVIDNNGSTDETVAIVEQYQDKLYLRIVDCLPARHHRNGAWLAAGEYFTCADDEVAPGCMGMGGALNIC